MVHLGAAGVEGGGARPGVATLRAEGAVGQSGKGIGDAAATFAAPAAAAAEV
jgi:hypothetical protein